MDYANGYKNKTVLTRMGEVTFEVPRVRSGGFYPSALDETPYLILDARYERVREAGRVLGVSVALSEAEVHWRAFLDSLIERGLRGVKFIASDDHAGLKAARKAMFPGVPWQRCQFHLQHNAQGYVSRLDQRTPVARQIHGIFNASDAIEAQRVRMRTANGLERLNKELKRRTRVATLFPNPDSCLRLISALLSEQDEEWMTAKIYLSMKS